MTEKHDHMVKIWGQAWKISANDYSYNVLIHIILKYNIVILINYFLIFL